MVVLILSAIAAIALGWWALSGSLTPQIHQDPVVHGNSNVPTKVVELLARGTPDAKLKSPPKGSRVIVGRVLNTSGEPVEGVLVRAHVHAGEWPLDAFERAPREVVERAFAIRIPTYGPWETVSGTDGRFTLRHIADGVDVDVAALPRGDRYGTASIVRSHEYARHVELRVGASATPIDVNPYLGGGEHEIRRLVSNAPRPRQQRLDEYDTTIDPQPRWAIPWAGVRTRVHQNAPSHRVWLQRARPGDHIEETLIGPTTQMRPQVAYPPLVLRIRNTNGEPVAHAKAVALWQGSTSEGNPVRCTTMGRSSVHGNISMTPRSVHGLVRVIVIAEGYAPFDVAFDRSSPRSLDVVLQPGAIVEGRVVSARGHPLSDIHVSLSSSIDQVHAQVLDWRARARQWRRSMVTGPDGTFRFTSLPQGKGRLFANANAWILRADHWGVAYEAHEGQTATRELVMSPARSALGVVRDAEGSTVSGATVTATSNATFPPEIRHTATQTDGTFSIASLATGKRYRFQATAPGLQSPKTKPLAVHEGLAPLTLTLGPSCSLRGQVLTDSNEPVPGRAVELVEGSRRVTTDDRGMFRFDVLSPGEHVVFLPDVNDEFEGPPVTRVLRVGDQVSDVVLRARMRHSLYGRVVDAQGHPMRGVRVRTHSRGLSSMHVNPGGYKILGDAGGEATTDEAGRFTIRGLTGSENYVVYVSGGQLDGTIDPGASPVQITVPDSLRVRVHGTVQSPDGEAVAHAKVRLRSVPKRRAWFPAGETSYVIAPAMNGSFDAEILTTHPNVAVTVTDALMADGTRLVNSSKQIVARESPPLRFELREKQADAADTPSEAFDKLLVRGIVVDPEGRPLAGIKVREEGGTGRRQRSTETLHDGTFELQVRLVESKLHIQPSRDEHRTLHEIHNFSAKANDEVVVVQLSRGHQLEGVVVGEHGEPVMTGRVTLSHVANPLADVGRLPGADIAFLWNRTNRFHFGPLKPGTYVLSYGSEHIGQRGRHWIEKPLHVTVPSPRVRMTLRETWNMGGYVQGDRIAAFRVYWYPDERAQRNGDRLFDFDWPGSVTKDGHIRMVRLREAKGRIYVRNENDDRYAVARVSRNANEPVIALKQGHRIQGRLQWPKPLKKRPGATVTATQNGIKVHTRYNEQGEFMFRGLRPGVWTLAAETREAHFGPLDVETPANEVVLHPAK